MPYTPRIVPATDRVTAAVKSEVNDRRSLYQERDKVMHELRRRRLLRHNPYLPKAFQRRFSGEKAAKLPIIYRLVQSAVASVSKRFPSVYVEAINAADRAAAEQMGKADNLLLQAVDTQSPTPLIYGGYFNIFGDGLWATKSLPGPWAGLPIRTDTESLGDYNGRVDEYLADNPLPFQCRNVDPLTFWPPLDEAGRGPAVESSWRTTRHVLQRLGLKPSGKDIVVAQPDEVPPDRGYPADELPPGMRGTVQVDEVWTNSECAISISGKVFILENPLGELPYVWGFGDPTGVDDPTNVGMSVAFPLYYLAPWIDTEVGVLLAWSLLAMPTMYTTQRPGPGIRPTQETAIEELPIGKMVHFATGREPGVVQPPTVGGGITQALSFLVDAAERGGLPALVSGMGVGTRLPALTFQAALEAGTDRLRPAAQSAERVIAGTIRKWHNIIGRYETPVRVNGWEYGSSGEPSGRGFAIIRPTEARKPRRISVSLAVDSTQDLIAKGTHAQFMMAAQLWDMEKAMRFAGVDNPEEMKIRIARDIVFRASLQPLAQATIESDPDVTRMLAESAGGVQAGGGEPPGPGRNRQGVPPGRGGGRRGAPTQRPRGNRQGPQGQAFGRT